METSRGPVREEVEAMEALAALSGGHGHAPAAGVLSRRKLPSETAQQGQPPLHPLGFRGVCYNRMTRRWQAGIAAHGRAISLGAFDAEEDAARIYDKAALRIRGLKATVNFPVRDYLLPDGALALDLQVEALLLEAFLSRAVPADAATAAAVGDVNMCQLLATHTRATESDQQRQRGKDAPAAAAPPPPAVVVAAIQGQLPPGCELESLMPPKCGFVGVLYAAPPSCSASGNQAGAGLWDGAAMSAGGHQGVGADRVSGGGGVGGPGPVVRRRPSGGASASMSTAPSGSTWLQQSLEGRGSVMGPYLVGGPDVADDGSVNLLCQILVPQAEPLTSDDLNNVIARSLTPAALHGGVAAAVAAAADEVLYAGTAGTAFGSADAAAAGGGGGTHVDLFFSRRMIAAASGCVSGGGAGGSGARAVSREFAAVANLVGVGLQEALAKLAKTGHQESPPSK
eukprot:XP_001699461.1 predicted protein [Chlamydomonas reinhardtii]